MVTSNFRKLIQVILVCGFYFGLVSGFAQSIQNLNATFSSTGKVLLSYDVVGAKPNQSFSLDLYSSHNNFSTPLKHVSGDIGKNIPTGTGKKVNWDAAAELGNFNGQVTFKVKGEMIPLAFELKGPVNGASARRGKNMNILWEGGKPDQVVLFELLKDNNRVLSLGETKNSGQYAWRIPKKFAKGTYSIKLTAGQEVKQSALFKVKARIPMLVKLLPILAVGGAVVVLGGGGEGTTNNDLPAAPGPK